MSLQPFWKELSNGARKYSGIHVPVDPDWSTLFISKFIIKYFRKHKDDKADDEDENEKEKNDQEVPKWDSEFLKVDQGTLFGMAQSSLDIGSFKDNYHFQRA